MIRSMTGYASAAVDLTGYCLSWELRSVNHRYLEIALRLPEKFRPLEPALRGRIGSAVRRGKLDAYLTIRAAGGEAGALELDLDLLKKLLSAAQVVESYLPQPSAYAALDLLRWPGVLQERPLDPEEFESAALETLDRALRQMDEVRAREGAQMAEFMSARGERLRTLATETQHRLPEVLREIRDKLRSRCQELGVHCESDRLEQELLFYANRLDVSEELDRLSAHVDEFLRLLQQEEPVGRRLDFLLQEMNREANTLASKSQDLATTRTALEMKVIIEQLREQAQNVE